MLDLPHTLLASTNEDESVVRILKDGARSIRQNGVCDIVRERSIVQNSTQNIGHNEKEVGGQRIALAEAITTIDPTIGNAVQKDSGFAGGKKGTYPLPPAFREAPALKDSIEAIPIDSVKGFVEVNLKDDGGQIAAVAAV